MAFVQRRSALLVALGVLLVIAEAPADARHPGQPSIDHYVFADGTGKLVANPSGDSVVWKRCPSDGSACSPYDDGDGNPQTITVRDDPPGTTFTSTQDDITTRSETWRGRLRATLPPRVEGKLRVGERVKPVAAAWEGGWGLELDWLQLQVCRTAGGSGCTVVFDPIRFGSCEQGGGRVLPASAVGKWLRVVDVRFDKWQLFTQERYESPEGVSPNVPGAASVAGVVVGRIATGRAPSQGCGISPSFVTPRTTVRRARDGRYVAATATCGTQRCPLHVRIRQGSETVTFRRVLRFGETPVSIPRPLLGRLQPGALLIDTRIGTGRRSIADARLVRSARG